MFDFGDKPHSLVVGSGPSGLASAYSLLKRGFKVTIIDYGNVSDKDNNITGLYDTNSNREMLINVKVKGHFEKKNNKKSDLDIIKDNRCFKSNYFFADSEECLIERTENAVAHLSLAKGGLTNLWGGSVLPPYYNDICDWPISVTNLQPFYPEIVEYMGISASEDSISDLFRFNVGGLHSYPFGQQAKEFFSDLKSQSEVLLANNFYYGRAKTAIDPKKPLDHRYPFGPIFNSGTIIDELQESEDCTYIPNVFVEEIVESDECVNVKGRRKGDQKLVNFQGHKVFLACGPISSTRIVANSLNLVNHEFLLKTNQNMFMPFFRFSRTKGISRQRTNSIPQLFFTITGSQVRNRAVHIQVCQYGDYVTGPIRKYIPKLEPFITSAMRPLFERIMVFQTMLHSDFSDSIRLKLSKNNSNSFPKVELYGISNPEMKSMYNQVMKLLRKHHRQLRGIAFSSLMMIDQTGESSHLGCTMPMRYQPVEGETDLLGRPPEWCHTHIVDSTVLPSLPATTITFPIMANATRIVDEVAKQCDHSKP